MKFILIAEKEVSKSFFPVWEVITFVMIVTLILIVLFPRNLLEKILANPQYSVLTLCYLKGFKEIYPQNKLILISLIEKEIAAGELTDARKNVVLLNKLEPTPSPDTLLQLRWLDYLLLRYQTYQTKINTPKRITYLGQLRAVAKTLANAPLNYRQLSILAIDNIALDQADISLKIYNHLFDSAALTTPQELVTGAKIAMQNNAHRDSARFYWAAYQKAITLREKREYALDAIKVLWAGNDVNEALALANKLPDEVINTREILFYLSQLAMAANRPELAQKYALKALLTNSHIKHE